jgi:hypothetical protein
MEEYVRYAIIMLAVAGTNIIPAIIGLFSSSARNAAFASLVVGGFSAFVLSPARPLGVTLGTTAGAVVIAVVAYGIKWGIKALRAWGQDTIDRTGKLGDSADEP